MPEGSMVITVEVRNRLAKQARAMDEAIDDLAKNAAESAAGFARVSMLEPKTGRMYGTHRASAPGQAPAIRPFPEFPTGGDLFASIRVIKLTDELYHVSSGNVEAKYLEYGTRHMAPRPFFRPAARKAAAETRVKGRITVKMAAARQPW